VSESASGVPPYRVVYSGLCRDETRRLLGQAKAKGKFDEIAQAIREVDERLHWIPLDFGEPVQDLVHLGVKVHVGVISPLVVRYGVDEVRRVVYVAVPFELLPNSGL
jgi:hypothetical protein